MATNPIVQRASKERFVMYFDSVREWRKHLSAIDWTVLSVIIDKIYGWSKEYDAVSTSQILDETTLPIRTIQESIARMVPAREVSQAGVAIVTRDAATKLSIRQEGDQLREDGAALVHEPLSAGVKRTLGASCYSNRGKAQIAANH